MSENFNFTSQKNGESQSIVPAPIHTVFPEIRQEQWVYRMGGKLSGGRLSHRAVDKILLGIAAMFLIVASTVFFTNKFSKGRVPPNPYLPAIRN